MPFFTRKIVEKRNMRFGLFPEKAERVKDEYFFQTGEKI